MYIGNVLSAGDSAGLLGEPVIHKLRQSALIPQLAAIRGACGPFDSGRKDDAACALVQAPLEIPDVTDREAAADSTAAKRARAGVRELVQPHQSGDLPWPEWPERLWLSSAGQRSPGLAAGVSAALSPRRSAPHLPLSDGEQCQSRTPQSSVGQCSAGQVGHEARFGESQGNPGVREGDTCASNGVCGDIGEPRAVGEAVLRQRDGHAGIHARRGEFPRQHVAGGKDGGRIGIHQSVPWPPGWMVAALLGMRAAVLASLMALVRHCSRASSPMEAFLAAQEAEDLAVGSEAWRHSPSHA